MEERVECMVPDEAAMVDAEPKTRRAVWKGVVLAESDSTVVVEGNHYFAPGTIRREYFHPSETHTICGWKGEASYYNVVVDGDVNRDAAWFYPAPKQAAANIKNHVAFWRGVTVE